MSSSTGQGLAAGSAAPTTGHPILSKLNFVKIIGTGTFARVYLVRNGTNQKFEAVKVLSISDVIRMKQIDHVKNERSILNEVMHPFLINLRWHAKDEANLYLGFPYICGGELFSYLRSSGRFAPNAAQFYAAEIVSALSYLHSLSIVYRDLKVNKNHSSDFNSRIQLCLSINKTNVSLEIMLTNPTKNSWSIFLLLSPCLFHVEDGKILIRRCSVTI